MLFKRSSHRSRRPATVLSCHGFDVARANRRVLSESPATGHTCHPLAVLQASTDSPNLHPRVSSHFHNPSRFQAGGQQVSYGFPAMRFISFLKSHSCGQPRTNEGSGLTTKLCFQVQIQSLQRDFCCADRTLNRV